MAGLAGPGDVGAGGVKGEGRGRGDCCGADAAYYWFQGEE